MYAGVWGIKGGPYHLHNIIYKDFSVLDVSVLHKLWQTGLPLNLTVSGSLGHTSDS